MSACETYTQAAGDGVAPALRAVDCLANGAAQGAFDRLFGGGGALTSALTIVLTIYIAFFAISLMTGRSRIGISALTPRMLTLGLVLTFTTSWVAYQSVVWNLAVGGPDQIAAAMMGTAGSATEVFGHRIDIVFSAIAEAAANGAAPVPGAPPTPANAGTFTPANLMWISALLLLLGTVGILVAARIALAVLLVLGPVFIVLALFKGTRGLFAGWVRGVTLTAVTPLFAVLGGGFMLELAVPALNALNGAEGIDGRAAITLFVIASVHVALMFMVLKVAGAMVAGWSVFGLSNESADNLGKSEFSAPAFAAGAAAAQIGQATAVMPIASPRRPVGITPPPAAPIEDSRGPLPAKHREAAAASSSTNPRVPAIRLPTCPASGRAALAAGLQHHPVSPGR